MMQNVQNGMRNGYSAEGAYNLDDADVSEIFGKIAARQLQALMFHSSMVEYFQFLGLAGFKRWQEYRFMDEYKEYRKILSFYQRTYNKLCPFVEPEKEYYIPQDWYKYTRFDVDADTKKKAVMTAFDKWQEWERGTSKFLQKCVAHLQKANDIAAADFVQDMVDGNLKEIESLEKCYLKMKTAGFAADYIAEIQPELHTKYKEKELEGALKKAEKMRAKKEPLKKIK